MKREIRLIITDLDNTIWDWLSMWYNSFSILLQRLESVYGIDHDVLIGEFKELHRKYHSSEASYILFDLECIKDLDDKSYLSNKEASDGGKTILHEYYSAKKHSLKLYNGAKDFLEYMKTNHIIVVGFTESNSFFAKYRIKHLELAQYFDAVYAPKDFELPKNVQLYYPAGYWESEVKFEDLPQKSKKPDVAILERIIKDYKVDKSNVLYIGDKLDRDILMANQAGVLSAYAKYGDDTDSQKYELLKAVTHWTDEEVQREILAHKTRELGSPNYTIDTNLAELFSNIKFIKTYE